MSSYFSRARRKNSTSSNYEDVEMLDNYFGQHKYAVRFPDGEIVEEKDCDFDEITSHAVNTEIYRNKRPKKLRGINRLIKKLWKK